MPWYVTTDNLIQVCGLTDARSGQVVDDATCSATLYGRDGQPVTGAIDVALTSDGTGGNYTGVLPSTLTLDRGWSYRLVVTCVSDAGTLTIEQDDLAAVYKGE